MKLVITYTVKEYMRDWFETRNGIPINFFEMIREDNGLKFTFEGEHDDTATLSAVRDIIDEDQNEREKIEKLGKLLYIPNETVYEFDDMTRRCEIPNIIIPPPYLYIQYKQFTTERSCPAGYGYNNTLPSKVCITYPRSGPIAPIGYKYIPGKGYEVPQLMCGK